MSPKRTRQKTVVLEADVRKPYLDATHTGRSLPTPFSIIGDTGMPIIVLSISKIGLSAELVLVLLRLATKK
jgi:hypothetical protein